MKTRGSCLCGKIRYEVNKTSDDIDHCHCTFCQKYHGAAFGTYIEPVTPENFSWLEGEKLVSRYQSSSHSARLFCSACGSALVAEINGGEVLAPTLATLDGDVEVGESAHMFWQSKASWCEINDDLPKYDTYPPGMDEFTPTD